MVFEYTIKYNGKKYLPGQDVPMDEVEKATSKKAKEPIQSSLFDNNPLETAREVFEKKAEVEKKGRTRKSKE